VTRLVALDLPGGPTFVEALQRCWDRGDAVAVVPQDLPAAGRQRWLDVVRPHIALAASGDEVVVDPMAPALDDGDALVVTTSGSTGDPKVLVHSIAGLEAHATAVHERLAVDPAADRWVACLPLHHLGGFGVVARALLTATPLDVLARFEADAVAAAPRSGATLVSLVPTALDRIEPSAYRWVVLGGSGDLAARPPNVVRTYGLTETGGGVVYDGTALAGTEVRVGADGAIALRGPTLARGRRAPDGTVSPVVDADGWLRTGDLGRWTEDRLVVDGRADDLIVTGGENVWPLPVESVLGSHPSVAEVVVAGVADPEWGQRVVALVVPADPGHPPTLAELRALAKDHLPPAAAPRELRVVDALDRTALGKPVRPRS
jgi:O-succinylbenzoic acid--CoA ligase